MGKVVAAINVTLDGFCDHTAGIPDADLHNHYTELLRNAGAVVYGRITYQLMKDFWPTLIETPSGEAHMDAFAQAMQHVPKIVFSRTLKEAGWENAELANNTLADELEVLKSNTDKDICIGSPGLIAEALSHGLIDELQLCVHPVLLGSGKPLFKNPELQTKLILLRNKQFSSGAIILYYKISRKQ